MPAILALVGIGLAVAPTIQWLGKPLHVPSYQAGIYSNTR